MASQIYVQTAMKAAAEEQAKQIAALVDHQKQQTAAIKSLQKSVDELKALLTK